jgi:hypothetical protein
VHGHAVAMRGQSRPATVNESKTMITTQKQIRALFWATFPDLSRVKIPGYAGTGRMYTTDTRCTFADYVDELHRDGEISEALANRATL